MRLFLLLILFSLTFAQRSSQGQICVRVIAKEEPQKAVSINYAEGVNAKELKNEKEIFIEDAPFEILYTKETREQLEIEPRYWFEEVRYDTIRTKKEYTIKTIRVID